MPRHACLGATSACAFSPSPPTHHASPPRPSPCLLLVHVPTPFATHTQPSHTTMPHTRVVAGALWCPGCVCVPTVLAVAAPGSPLTRPPTPCAPHHTTPPLAAAAAGGGGCGGGSVGVVACVATWSTHWLCWCCPLPIHTHTHGVMGTWWWWLCGVVWLPPPLCAFPTNHHHCVRCPALSAVCVCVSGGTTHTRPLWCHPRWCVRVSERRGHHTHHPRCRPMCPLSPLTRHATPATLSQMPRLTSLTHMACFVWLLSSTHSHTGWLTAHTPSTHHHHWVCVCSSTCSHPPHTHTGRTGVAHAWVVAGVVTTTTPLVPHHHTHTHSGTGGVGHGGAWWCACALCVPPTPPSHSPSLPPPPPTLLCHHRPHTHTRDLVHAPLPLTHTPHAPPHTPRRAVC